MFINTNPPGKHGFDMMDEFTGHVSDCMYCIFNDTTGFITMWYLVLV